MPAVKRPRSDDNASDHDSANGDAPPGDGVADDAAAGNANKRQEVRGFNTYLTCALCGGYLKNAHTVSECVHTFCKDCLYNKLNAMTSNPKCPMPGCETHLVCKVKANVRTYHKIMADHAKQAVVNRMFPQMVMEDQQLEAAFNKERGIDTSAKSTSGEVESAPVNGAKPRQTSRRKSDGGAAAPAANGGSNGESGGRRQANVVPKQSAVVFQVLPATTDDPSRKMVELAKPTLKSDEKLRVGTLRKYLSKKCSVSEDKVEVMFDGTPLPADADLKSLQLMLESQSRKPDKLTLHYWLKQEPPTA
eukprot:TRINITY_DN1658_c0_g1_i1.p1 TRINITY_DN1658_c0_g1~~TRINITY_DN1658_c0_g1_i1.p1  ORF type:complete len:305 (-),score=57.30 TRINITY_DN1658_c0_g1_i1:337-1251(-)